MRDHTLKTIIDVTSDGGRVFAEHHTPDEFSIYRAAADFNPLVDTFNGGKVIYLGSFSKEFYLSDLLHEAEQLYKGNGIFYDSNDGTEYHFPEFVDHLADASARFDAFNCLYKGVKLTDEERWEITYHIEEFYRDWSYAYLYRWFTKKLQGELGEVPDSIVIEYAPTNIYICR